MSLTRTTITDHATLLSAALAGLPPIAICVYLFARILIPVVLIIYASRGATPKQRIDLVRDYVKATPNTDHSAKRPNDDNDRSPNK